MSTDALTAKSPSVSTRLVASTISHENLELTMEETEYLRLRAMLDSEHRRKVKSLDETWAIDHAEPPPKPIEGHDDAVDAVRGAWRQFARQVIDELPEGQQFTIREIESGIKKKSPLLRTDRIAISGLLKAIADSNELKIIEQGRGRRATIYGKNNKKA